MEQRYRTGIGGANQDGFQTVALADQLSDVQFALTSKLCHTRIAQV